MYYPLLMLIKNLSSKGAAAVAVALLTLYTIMIVRGIIF